MELMLTMEESDGIKSKSRTVHTQTDFGPYSAFPPPSDQEHLPAAPLPVNTEQQVVTEDGHDKTSDDTNHQDATNVDTTDDTVDGPTAEERSSYVNGLRKERISIQSEEFKLIQTSYRNALEHNPWERKAAPNNKSENSS